MKKLCTTRDMDLISALPDNLIQTILSMLPLRDAARTCILSRKWRCSWVKLPHLQLDASFWQESIQVESQDRAAKFAIILFRILLLHQGPITSICLHIPELESPPEIHTLINFIVRNGVRKCVLLTFPGGHFKLDSSLFTCPTLNYLDLRSCEINLLPTTFERCSNLTTITLADVTISAQALKTLVSSCPFLCSLQLKVPVDIQCLEINAPKLVHFLYYYSNSFQSSVSVNYAQRHQAILRLLGGFPLLKYLYLDYYCVKFLAADEFLTRLPGMLRFLKFINLANICLEDVEQFNSVLCLIRSSPGLRKLKIDLHRSTLNNNNNMENRRGEEDYSDLTINRLEEVEMSYVVGGRLDLEFIWILLARSPSLRKMKIGLTISNTFEKLKIIKEMFMFPRAAPNVKVLIED
ncbi:hypothetical protein Leryth_020216 [Lithospermum erythrorhizon]|nr:hypothetical protein Leryth_020216 [Lithospermum erythrorhizon]